MAESDEVAEDFWDGGVVAEAGVEEQHPEGGDGPDSGEGLDCLLKCHGDEQGLACGFWAEVHRPGLKNGAKCT